MSKPTWTVLSGAIRVKAATISSIKAEVKAFTKEDLTALALEAVEGKIPETQFKSLKAFASSIAYDGFNPQVIIALLAEKAKNGQKDDEKVTFTLDKTVFSATKGIDFGTDVQILITLFLVRGNNLFKIMKTVSKEAKVLLAGKIAAYGLKSDDDADAAARKRKEKVVLSSTDITLSRIASSFPHLTLAIAKEAQIAGKASLAAITAQMKIDRNSHNIPSIPHVLQHGMIPALLSKTEPDNERDLRQFCYMFNLEQTITLQHPAAKKVMLLEPISSQVENSMKFVSAAIQGPLMSDDVRQDILGGLLGLEDDPDIKSWIIAGSNAWVKASSASNYSSLMLNYADQVARINTGSASAGSSG
ncbi:nucleocapsid protein [Euproctis pseudoconspersa bunyavirus]|uniref:Nucleoprotein n=1 Tax=Euproctis pseudoconspersa bunyavirus TaxID=2769516 RepID=A0A7H0S6L4_9VIRU|nr:nucleocapsid protein [Euproctis pseudoconspersa bunyavirus]QNQ79765.1 nucleocapsid protein [Euproctis pseudoconspersa bunyavirus]